MGLLDRFTESTSDETTDPSLPAADAASPIAEHLLSLLSPFVDPQDQMGGMLFGLARRFLADATDDQLREVVAHLCQSADALRPYLGTPSVGVPEGPQAGQASQESDATGTPEEPRG